MPHGFESHPCRFYCLMLGGSKTRFRVFKVYRLYRKDFWGILLDKKQHRYRGCIYDILKYRKRFYYKILSFVYGGKKIATKRYSYGGSLFLTKQRFRLFYNNMKTAQIGDLLALARRRRGKRFDFYDSFFGLLESRLDCLLVRSLFVSNFKQARLFINHRIVYVNDFIVRKLGYYVQQGDVVTIKDIVELGYFFRRSYVLDLNVFDFVRFIYGYRRLERDYKFTYGKLFKYQSFLGFYKNEGFLVVILQFIRRAVLLFSGFVIKRYLVRFLRKVLVLLVLFSNYKVYLRSLFWLLNFRFGYFYYKSMGFLYNYNKIRLRICRQIMGKPLERVIGASFWRIFLNRSDFIGDFDTIKMGRLSERAESFIAYKRFALRKKKNRRSEANYFSLYCNRLYFFFGYPLYMEISYKLFRLIVVEKPSFRLVPFLIGLDGFRWVEFFRRRLYF